MLQKKNESEKQRETQKNPFETPPKDVDKIHTLRD
jgi:hypothetical protein